MGRISFMTARRLCAAAIAVGLCMAWPARGQMVGAADPTPRVVASDGPRQAASPRRAYRQPPAYVAVPAAARDRAEKQILIAARSDDAFVRCNAMEASEYLPQRTASLVAIGMRDPNPAVRFAALTILGKLKLVSLAPAAKQYLHDQHPSVRAAAMFALHRCGDPVDITPLASMLESDSPGVRSNTAMLLGMMGHPHAVAMLKDKAHLGMRQATPQQAALMRLQFAEAAVRLGDDLTMDAIRSGAFSQFEEVRVLAVSMMGRLRDRQMEPALQDMLDQDPVELRLAAADALARMGRPQGLDVLLKASQSPVPMVRAQAAMALGGFPHDEAAKTLVRLQDDRSQQVRIAAAAAILRRSAR
jgi:HEAT repeat protein